LALAAQDVFRERSSMILLQLHTVPAHIAIYLLAYEKAQRFTAGLSHNRWGKDQYSGA
jgi:hypothetical protein